MMYLWCNYKKKNIRGVMPRKYSSLCFWLCNLNWTRTNQYDSLRDHNKASPRPHNRHRTLRNHDETKGHFIQHYRYGMIHDVTDHNHYDMIHYVTVPQRNYRTRCITFADQSIPNHTIPSRDDKARHITMRNRHRTSPHETPPYQNKTVQEQSTPSR